MALFEHTGDMEDGLPLTYTTLVTVEWFNMVEYVLLDYLVFINIMITREVTMSNHLTMAILSGVLITSEALMCSN